MNVLIALASLAPHLFLVGPRADGGVPDAGVAVRPASPAAPSPAVVALVTRVQAFYEKTADFTADFTQKYTYATFKRTQTSTGTVTYRRPAMMRWEYRTPAAKTFVLAGERAYAYDPTAKLLTRTPVAQNQLSASVTFLWGKGKLLEEFTITEQPCPRCTGALLELVPLRPDPRFGRVLLEVDRSTAQVVTSTVVDHDGSTNTITFQGLKTNVGVPESAFKLTPPPGTQVQDLVP